MSKTKNHRKLRKRRGGDPDPAPVLGQAPAPVLGQPAPVLGQAPATGTETAQTSEPSMFSPPAIDPTTPQRPPGPPGPVQGTVPAPVPPPTPSLFGKLLATVTSPFKKKEESPEATSTSPSTGLFSSKFSLNPSTWFGGKSRRHGKNKKSNKKSKKSKKSRKSNKH